MPLKPVCQAGTPGCMSAYLDRQEYPYSQYQKLVCKPSRRLKTYRRYSAAFGEAFARFGRRARQSAEAAHLATVSCWSLKVSLIFT